tara:strand:- start:32434 stop:33357 length:924 start_codon:yes stop_codon:yes gene_type:complete
MSKTFYSNGKLLLTGEYVVLDGAQALAIPSRYGQSLTVDKGGKSGISWRSLDHKNNIWLETFISAEQIIAYNKDSKPASVEERLLQILAEAKRLNTNFLKDDFQYQVTTHLDFPTNWGLGTSSTLINNIAEWAEINAYELLNNTFGGSGYDIACAKNNTPILYKIKHAKSEVKAVKFQPDFADRIFFIYLNQKRNSRDAIASYKNQPKTALNRVKTAITDLTYEILECDNLSGFENLLKTHENLLSELINSPTVQSVLFSNYNSGIVKSLGGWGGDFVMATGSEEDMTYFKNKGYETIIPFSQMILK